MKIVGRLNTSTGLLVEMTRDEWEVLRSIRANPDGATDVVLNENMADAYAQLRYATENAAKALGMTLAAQGPSHCGATGEACVCVLGRDHLGEAVAP